MKSIRHLAILTPGFARDEPDSSCIPPLQLYVKHLAQTHSALKISIIALQYPEETKTYLWNGLEVYSCGGKNRKFPRKLLTWKDVVQQFNHIHRQHPVDVIHSFWLTEAALLGNYLSKKNAVPHVVTLMGQDAKPENIYQKVLDLKHPRLVAVSDFQQRLFDAQNKNKIDAVIPWGLDTNDFQETRVAERDIDILGVGSLIPLKDYSTFIEIVSSLSAQFQNLKITLVGDGLERDKLQEHARSAGLEITFTGAIARKKVLELMMRSKVFLHPSVYESQGFVFNEALYAGCNVVSKQVGIARSTPFWKMGETIDELSDAVKTFLRGKNNQPGVVLHSIEDTVRAYWKIYHS